MIPHAPKQSMTLTVRCRALSYPPNLSSHTNPPNSLVDPGSQGGPFTVEVGLHDTIALLKYSILEAASIPIYEQRIVPSVSEEAPAHDERGLQACGFFDGVIVTMYRIPLPVPVFEVEDPFKVGTYYIRLVGFSIFY